MAMKKTLVLWGAALVAQLFSCGWGKPDPAEILPGGRWLAAEATRDGKPTGTLTDLFYEFLPNDSLYTNIAGSPQGMRYYIVDNVIQQRKGPFDADLVIESITPAEMVVHTILNESEFRVRFVKQAQQPQ